MRQVDYGNYMRDCIHLHACRSLHKRFRIAGARYVARFCNDDCRCYQTARIVYSPDVGVIEEVPEEEHWVIEDGPACTTKTSDWCDTPERIIKDMLREANR